MPCGLILIVDHGILRDGLRTLLNTEREFQLIAEASTVADGVALVRRFQPDAVVIDLSFPQGGAIAAIGTLRRECAGTGIVVLTVHNTEECGRAATQAGAHGFVPKDAPFEVLLSALRAAIDWQEHFTGSMSSAELRGILSVRRRAVPVLRLTIRERQVLVGVAQGYTSREIAATLARSVKTVIKHRSNMMKKLSLHDVSAVTRFAIENGLLSL
ncbi:MAG: response regulator transcription factor [Gammaproteobacteria bacterium]